MDALAAIGLASNIAQFVEYGIDFVKVALEITQSPEGETEQNATIRVIVQDMTNTLKDINTSGSDETLDALASKCLSASSEINTIIAEISRKPEDNIVQTLHKAGKSLLKRKEVRELADRLSSIRVQISHHLLVLLRKQQLVLGKTVDALSASSETSHAELAASLEKTIKMLGSISSKLNDKSSRSASDLYIPSPQFSLDDALNNHILPYATRVTDMMEQKKEKILRTLHYDQLWDREYSITDAHTKTFQWIFGAHSAFKFREWLQEESGIYWITGKPGSGKSTLMKFVTEQYVTKQLLLEWSGSGNSHDLVIAKHFFWSPGTSIQKSQEGLFRALLFQILSQRPEIINQVCAERWNASYADSFGPWSRRQLLGALENLGTMQNATFKACIFLDGLDEYDGDHAELVRIIRKIGSPPNIKICAASRPWLDFLDAFESSPWKLRIHDLTRDDMETFVREKLHGNPRFQRLQSSNWLAASYLVNDITERAQGVFLWTFLVVHSLLRGLRNEDEISDLRRRVEALPDDLSEYFDRMLLSIEDVYQQRASRLFLTMSLARTTFPVIAFFYMEFDDISPDKEPLSFLADWPDVDQDKVEILMVKKRQLIAQCKDLIFISADPTAPVLFAERVGFLHRTVVDFLQTDDVNRKLIRLAGRDFEPRRTLLQTNLGQARSLMHLHGRTYIRSRLAQWILGCMYYAYQLEVSTGKPQITELDELKYLIDKHLAHRWTFSHAMDVLFELPEITTFLTLATGV
ncbi:hypothetical protein VMCG_05045 [Cytospora schulzeri]|uniref:NACHT domain-containing protein n=1 Tax=Cytospora schulzeri TaxID=448051 RepID=A0A423WMU0_9PEZI|nr:hypothetical protein VMCG_05045 [Valsa malicola]